MKVLIKDIEILLAMHNVNDPDDFEDAVIEFKYGWADGMIDYPGQIWFAHREDYDCVYIDDYIWHKDYIIKMEGV